MPAGAPPSFRIVKDLAADLSAGTITFPTLIDATLKIRRTLDDPNVTADRVARTVSRGKPNCSSARRGKATKSWWNS